MADLLDTIVEVDLTSPEKPSRPPPSVPHSDCATGECISVPLVLLAQQGSSYEEKLAEIAAHEVRLREWEVRLRHREKSLAEAVERFSAMKKATEELNRVPWSFDERLRLAAVERSGR